jgi:hypothetical protein
VAERAGWASIIIKFRKFRKFSVLLAGLPGPARRPAAAGQVVFVCVCVCGCYHWG